MYMREYSKKKQAMVFVLILQESNMSQPMQPQQIRNIGSYGAVREASVDYSLAPEGSVPDVQNFHFDRIGAATVRPGMATLGATVAAGLLHVYVDYAILAD